MPNRQLDSTYRNRYLLALILAELIILGLFRFWPITDSNQSKNNFSFSEEELVLVDVPVTRRSASPPAPSRPEIVPPEPTDEIIEEDIEFEEFDFSEALKNPPGDAEGQANSESGSIAQDPDTSPQITRIMELNVPREARQANLDARIEVRFLVGIDGRVEEATIQLIEIYDEETQKYVEVENIGYNIEDRVLSAARQWRFRPAQKNGESVAAYAVYDFSI